MEEVIHTLSWDQKYLYEMCQSVTIGHCSPEIANQQPGKMAHSRRLTTANRVLRLYVGSSNPLDALKILVEYTRIKKVYDPVWFNIKRQPS
jgi:hypothetical protein